MSYLTGGDELNSQDRKMINKEIKSRLRDINKATKTIDTVRAKMAPPKVTASMGIIPERIYRVVTITQTDICSRLPPEIQRIIWSYLVQPADRISFGLTCKSNAQIYEELKSVYGKIAIKRFQKHHRLAVLVRMQRWMPKAYRLCFNCVQFKRKAGGGEWGGNRAYETERLSVRESQITKDAITRGPRCFDCRIRDGIDQLKHTEAVMELKAVLRENRGSLAADRQSYG